MLQYFGLTVLILLLGVAAGVLVGGTFWWASRDRREEPGQGLRLTHWIVFASMGAGAGGYALSANLLDWPGYAAFLGQTLVGALGGALLVAGVLLLARAMPGGE